MRPVGITTLFTAVLVVAAVRADVPPAGPVRPADARLDAHLAAWEGLTGRTKSFVTEFEVTKTEAVFGRKRKYTGSAWFMKPNLGLVRIKSEADPQDHEVYLCNGKSVYQYDGSKKLITEAKLAPGQTTPGDNPVFALVSGMTAAETRRRFRTAASEDDYYVYLDILPTRPKDRQEFEQIRFALYGPGVKDRATPFAPVAVTLLRPNGDKELWTCSGQQLDPPKVTEAAFQFRMLEGWQLRQAPPPGPAATRP